MYSIKTINLRIFQIIFHYYIYENNNISNNSFNLYLFKRVTIDANIDQWHAGLGRFHSYIVIPKTKKKLSDPIIIFKCMFTFFYNVLIA